MNRRHLPFTCESDILVGTLDEGDAATGLIIVSGGNEIRSGAFSGQAMLAAAIAAKGYPVFRFDRRGIGDSEGDNRGFRGSRADILAAIAAFRAQCPQMTRVVAFGNCDAASALMLMGGEMCDALVLSNPWTFDTLALDEQLPPPTAVRSRYAAKLRRPTEWRRLVTGDVSITRLLRGLRGMIWTMGRDTSLIRGMRAGLDEASIPHRILVAAEDRTGQAFAASWSKSDSGISYCEGASHAYVEPHARQWLEEQILQMLER